MVVVSTRPAHRPDDVIFHAHRGRGVTRAPPLGRALGPGLGGVRARAAGCTPVAGAQQGPSPEDWALLLC